MNASPRLLLPQHQKLITGSAISPEVSVARGYWSEETRKGIRALGFSEAQCIVPALVIPVFNVNGEAASWQIRPDVPRVVRDKIVKYESRARAPMQIDAHPRLTRKRPRPGSSEADDPSPLPPLIADNSLPLLVTEGIRKGDCLVSLDLCCIALAGVWSWRGKNAAEGITALGDWELVHLKAREVYLVFDSDVTAKRGPAQALARLKAFLELRGAHVHAIYLPSDDGLKVGVDDWVLAQKQAGKDDGAIRRGLFALAEDELRPQPTKPDPKGRPSIVVKGGQLPEHVDDALRVAAQNHERMRLFERPALPDYVYIHVNPVKEEDKPREIRRPAGAVTMRHVTRAMLEDKLTRAIDWRRYREIQGDIVPIDCPRRIAETVLSRAGDGELPELVGVIEAPIMRRDGTILTKAGYDPDTGLFLYSNEQWLRVPDNPTSEDVKTAKAILLEPIAEFPFVDEAARSVVLSGMITAIQRRLLPGAPLHALDAPMQSSGKTLLGDLIGIIGTGRDATSISVPKDSDEMRKRITSILLAGDWLRPSITWSGLLNARRYQPSQLKKTTATARLASWA